MLQEKERKDSAGSDDTASMIKGGGYTGMIKGGGYIGREGVT